MVALPDTNRTRLIRKARPIASFFNFFSPPEPPSEDAIENGDVDEEELEELEEKLEVDYQLGEDIKEKVCTGNLSRGACAEADAVPQIIPRAIDYFTGKALEFEDFDDDDDDFEDMEDDDDDDEDDFEDDVCLYPISSAPSLLASGANFFPSFFHHLLRLCNLVGHLQDDDSDEDIPARRRGPPKGRGAGANQNTNPEECTQQ